MTPLGLLQGLQGTLGVSGHVVGVEMLAEGQFVHPLALPGPDQGLIAACSALGASSGLTLPLCAPQRASLVACVSAWSVTGRLSHAVWQSARPPRGLRRWLRRGGPPSSATGEGAETPQPGHIRGHRRPIRTPPLLSLHALRRPVVTATGVPGARLWGGLSGSRDPRAFFVAGCWARWREPGWALKPRGPVPVPRLPPAANVSVSGGDIAALSLWGRRAASRRWHLHRHRCRRW